MPCVVKTSLAAALCLLSTLSWALGVGAMQVDSGLNQPLDARIPIVGAKPGELADVSARLADQESFDRAGLARPYVLSKLRFEVVESAETAGYIHVTSRDAIREPALEFIVAVSWRGGGLQRKYSLLLEPK